MSITVTHRSYFDEDTPYIVLKSLFSKYDTNGNGRICTTELVMLLQDDLGLSKDDAQTYTLLLDKDGSGDLSFEELRDWIKSGERLKNMEDASRYKAMQKAVRIFKYYDTDASGGLDRSEFRQLHADVGGRPEFVDVALNELDTDGNGVISFYEFMKWLNWVDLGTF